MQFKIINITRSTLIDEDQVDMARSAGLCLHHEVEYQKFNNATEEGVYDWVDELIRDDWYAASPEWVADYHRNGGMWAYAD